MYSLNHIKYGVEEHYINKKNPHWQFAKKKHTEKWENKSDIFLAKPGQTLENSAFGILVPTGTSIKHPSTNDIPPKNVTPRRGKSTRAENQQSLQKSIFWKR